MTIEIHHYILLFDFGSSLDFSHTMHNNQILVVVNDQYFQISNFFLIFPRIFLLGTRARSIRAIALNILNTIVFL